MSIPFIDLKTQYNALKSSIDQRIQKVIDHGAFINGPEVQEVEKKLAEFVGCKHALVCASGTDALLIPMMAMNLEPGDEVITTAFSFIATAETILLAGAKPVYVDIDPVTYNIDFKKLEQAITPKTKGIIPVSLYGQVADMDEINAIAKKHHLWVIEDAAQSFGATYKNQSSGNLSLFGATSFFPAKPLGCYGDGGAIFTSDDKQLQIMKEIRDHGSERRYYHTRLGLNGRLDTLQCAILLAKLERYPWEVERRQLLGNRYNKAFSEIQLEGFKYPKIKSDRKSVWAQYTIEVPHRTEFQKKLSDSGVATSIHYPMIMPDQPYYKTKANVADWRVSRSAAEHVISLPIYPDLSEKIQDQIIEKVFLALK